MSPSEAVREETRGQRDLQRPETLAAQVHLLFSNAKLGAGVTAIAATVLVRLQWNVLSHDRVVWWWLYMLAVSTLRWTLAARFARASPEYSQIGKWRAAITVLSGLAGAGWGGAGIILYPQGHLTHQVFLVFVLGGMMLGAASVMAARPEAFLAFLIPAGSIPAVRLVFEGDNTHIAMGSLAVLFTFAVVMTAYSHYRGIDSSLRLQYENSSLVTSLQGAKEQTEALNEVLERRVQERTAELRRSAEQLRAEIAQRERMEGELLQARKLESIGVLAGGIAHDFNNFLTVMQGNVELAMTQLPPGDPVQQTLKKTVSACQGAALLSSQLLTFAKGGAPVRRVISIGDLVKDAVQLARAGSSVGILLEVASDLWLAEADPGQISQVLHNIFLNAREATSESGIVEVRAGNVVLPNHGDAERRVRILIRDHGCGIPDDILPRIFDPYFTTKPGATGLGLATAYAIVAKHNGQLHVESKPGHGSVFMIDLPAASQSPEPLHPATAGVEAGTGWILAMDDEEGIRHLLEAVLGRLGYDVQTARDGAEAIALYQAAQAEGRRFDVVLLDVTVGGGMGGVEAAGKLKAIDPSSRLIVSSGYSDAAVMSEFARFGFDAVLPKPWTGAEISSVLRRVLRPDCRVE